MSSDKVKTPLYPVVLTRLPLNRLVTAGLAVLLTGVLSVVNAGDDASKTNRESVELVTLSPTFPIMDIVAEETVRRLANQDINVALGSGDAVTNQRQHPTLLLAGLDSFIDRWDDKQAGKKAGSSKLLDTLVPVAEVVRDHQAFLMQQKRNAQELRSRFAMAHGASGPMKIGGLTPKGHRDHLVAMMLMDAAGQDPTVYPYRQYESLESMAMGLLTGEVQILSIPVSQALRMPLAGGITIVATSGNQRQDVIKNVPTLVGERIDMRFTNYIGLYRQESDDEIEQLLPLISQIDLSSSKQWPEQVYELGLVDDYLNQGEFAVNVLRELSTLRRFAELLD